MAKKFLVSIDLNQNELQKAVVHALATAPASGATGQIYFNTSDKKLYQWYDNAWNVVGREYSEATTSVSGLMSASDKTKLNGIASGAEVNVQSDWNQTNTSADDYIKNKPTIPSGVVVDNALSTTSENAVQNKVITNSLNTKAVGNGRIFYGTCSTAASTAAKVVTCSDYDQIGAGDIILVSFTYPNTASNPTLNVNSTGAKSLVQMYRGDYSTSQTGLKNPSSVRGLSMFVFSANKWVLVGANDWVTYGAGTQSELEEGASTANLLWSSKILHDYIASVVGGVDAMRFKGTVNSNSDLPTTGVKVGDTYMVNTAGTYAGQTCEVGDLIIATATTPTWTVAQTNIDGAITSLSGTAPISVSGSGSSRTIGIAAASGSAAGSMSSAHYTKLEGIAAGAEVNVQSNWTQTNSSADDYIKNKPNILKQVSTTITAGQTSASINGAYDVYSYKAEMSNAEVVVDFSSTNNTWSITTSQSSDITISAVVNG